MVELNSMEVGMGKKLLGLLFVLLLVVAALPAFAQEAETYGEDVGDAASAMNAASPIPAGHFAIIAHYADQYLSNPKVSPGRTILASKFKDGSLSLFNYYIVDIRSAVDYGKGHVPGAVNVPFAKIAKAENLVNYPTDKPIMLICYSGHTASMSSSILNTLGFNAWALKSGMSAWPCATYGCEY
jgi:rhodanese-related sulfurtransferase